MNKFQVILLTILVGCTLVACNKTDTSAKDAIANEWIKKITAEVVEENNVADLSLSINRYGQEPLFLSFGQTDEHSIYPVGLLSKTFTGIIANSLIEDGKLEYEEPLSTYFSDVLSEEALESFSNVPLKNLIHHRSGITDEHSSFYRNKQNEDVVLSKYSEEAFIADLNQIQIDVDDHNYQYSNFGYAIIGYLCETVSGNTYSELLTKYVTDKYDLQNTGVPTIEGAIEIFTLPTQQNTAPSLDMGKAIPAKGVYSDNVDLSKLQNRQIKDYQDYFERGIATPLILTERSWSTRIRGWKSGIGFMEITNEKGRYYGYYRDANGYTSVYLFSTYPNVGITMLTSDGGRWPGELALTILDGLVNEQRMQYPKRRSLAWKMFSVIDTDGLTSGLEWFENHKASKKYKLDESEMNSIGYRLLREENIKEAIEVFKLNAAQFPESSNVYDSLGEAYNDDGNTELAIINYEKSLALDPNNRRAERILKKLRPSE